MPILRYITYGVNGLGDYDCVEIEAPGEATKGGL